MISSPLPSADLEHIAAQAGPLWSALGGKRLFITGGTGFFGTWLLEALAYARAHLGINVEATVLSRAPETFLRRNPHFAAQPWLTWQRGDVVNFEFLPTPHDYVFHGATETYARLSPMFPLATFDTIVQGTRRVLDFARHTGAAAVLLTSSGAVYGRRIKEIVHVPEDYRGAPDCADAVSAHDEGKRSAELLGAIYHEQFDLPVKIARCFAFVGPHLPLDRHFAVGNFINDALHGRPVVVQGDGSPLRSYLHAADLMVWLLTILLRGQAARPYNVGSDQALSIADLARRVAEDAPGASLEVRIEQSPSPGAKPSSYVPDIQRAREELGLAVNISLEDAIRRTLAWHLGKGGA